MAPAADAPPMRKEWVFGSQEEGKAPRRMCPKRDRVRYDPSWNANNGPTKVGWVPSNWCNAVKGQRAEPVRQRRTDAPPPPPPRKGSFFDALMRKLATPRSGSRVRSRYCKWTTGSKRRGEGDQYSAERSRPKKAEKIAAWSMTASRAGKRRWM